MPGRDGIACLDRLREPPAVDGREREQNGKQRQLDEQDLSIGRLDQRGRPADLDDCEGRTGRHEHRDDKGDRRGEPPERRQGFADFRASARCQAEQARRPRRRLPRRAGKPPAASAIAARRRSHGRSATARRRPSNSPASDHIRAADAIRKQRKRPPPQGRGLPATTVRPKLVPMPADQITGSAMRADGAPNASSPWKPAETSAPTSPVTIAASTALRPCAVSAQQPADGEGAAGPDEQADIERDLSGPQTGAHRPVHRISDHGRRRRSPRRWRRRPIPRRDARPPR